MIEALLLVLVMLGDIGFACWVITGLLAHVMPFWAALCVGVPCGIFVFYIGLRVAFAGGKSINSMDIIAPHFFIIVLACVLFPVFAGARDKARRTACLSQMKDLGLGLGQYRSDWDDTLPAAASWADSAAHYLKPDVAHDAFRCPSAKSPYGYAFNIGLNRLPASKIKQPALYVMLFEANAGQRNAAGTSDLLVKPPRHGTNNYAFVDGHCKSLGDPWKSERNWDAADDQ